MNNQELVAYLVGLNTIMEAKEDAGIGRGTTLINEYNRHYDQLAKNLKKEHEDEARKRDEQVRRPEAGADQPRSIPRSSEPDRQSRGDR